MTAKTNRPGLLSLANGTRAVEGSAGNTGGVAGDYANDIVEDLTATVTFQDGGWRFDGKTAGDIARWEWNGHSADLLSVRARFRGRAAPSAQCRILEPRYASNYMARVNHETSGKIQLLDSAGAQRYLSPVSVPTSTPWAVGLRLRQSTGQLALELYLTGDGLGATPDASYPLTSGLNVGPSAFTALRIGHLSQGATGYYDLLDLQLDDTTLTALGPVSAPAPQISLGADRAAEPGTTLTLTATHTGGTAPTSWTWEQVSGPAVTLTGTGSSRSFVAPATFNGATVVIGCTPAAGTNVGAQDTVAVTVAPRQMWGRLPGTTTWLPIGPLQAP